MTNRAAYFRAVYGSGEGVAAVRGGKGSTPKLGKAPHQGGDAIIL